jgi:hypothetical protein
MALIDLGVVENEIFAADFGLIFVGISVDFWEAIMSDTIGGQTWNLRYSTACIGYFKRALERTGGGPEYWSRPHPERVRGKISKPSNEKRGKGIYVQHCADDQDMLFGSIAINDDDEA